MSAEFPNEPPGFTTISNWGMDSCPGSGWQPQTACFPTKSDGSAPLSPPTVSYTVHDPVTGQGQGDPFFSAPGQTEWFFGLWIWMDPQFYGTQSQLNKMFAFSLTNGDSFWLEAASGVAVDGPFYPQWSLSSFAGTSNCHLPLGFGDCGGTWILPGQSNPIITKGEWHRFEVYAKASSSQSGFDGTLRWWMDGALLGNFTDVNFGGALNFITVQPAWAGPAEPGWTHPSEWRYDHAYVSVPGTGGDTTPPSQVTNLSRQAGNGQVQLSWSPATDTGGSGLAGYIVGQALASGGPYTDTDVGNVTSHLVLGLTNGTEYFFRVRAYDGAGNHGANSTVVSATPVPDGSQVPVLGISPNGMFTINGVETYLLGFSYYDGSNWHASDIDGLTNRGFNLIRIFLDDVVRNDPNSAFNSDGSLRAAKQTAIQNLITYCAGRGMIVDVSILYADTEGQNSAAYLTTHTARVNAITNAINAFKANPNVMFDIVNEHNYGSFADTHAEMQTLMDAARAAGPTSIIFYSSSDNIGLDSDAHIFTTRSGSTVDSGNVNAELATGINVLAPHNDRSPGWNLLGTARTTNLRAYLNGSGNSGIPIYWQEDGREGSGGLGDAQAYIDYEEDVRLAGAAAWVFHNGYFNYVGTPILLQLNAIELQVINNIRAPIPPPILPTVYEVITATNGAIIRGTEDPGNPATAIRVCTDFGCVVEPISKFPGWPTNGTYTFQWLTGTTFACFHAQDATGAEDPVNYQCNSVIPGGTDITPPVAPTGLMIQ